MTEITPQQLHDALNCDPYAGELYWKPRQKPSNPLRGQSASIDAFNKRLSGRPAFTGVDKDGYRRGKVFGVDFRAHRVIWAMHYMRWPIGMVDHIDGDVANNDIRNLREATNTQNQWNQTPRGGSSQYRGVCWAKDTQKWQAQICIGAGKKRLYLGQFATEIEAAKAFNDAAIEHHGAFARLNVIL